jgi:hypothetical protein
MTSRIIIAAIAVFAVSVATLPARAGEVLPNGGGNGQGNGPVARSQGLPLIGIYHDAGGVPQRTVPHAHR